MRVLITGITGFVGSHLSELALKKGADVYGSIRWRSKRENIEHIKDHINFIECDLRDLSSDQLLIEEAMPDYIFHLAAQTKCLTCKKEYRKINNIVQRIP